MEGDGSRRHEARQQNSGFYSFPALNGDKRQRKEKEGWTVFINNLSRRVQRATLRELLNHYVRVENVFIPETNNRPKYRRSTFTFASVPEQSEMEYLIRKMDNTFIDGLRVRVTKARFPNPKAVRGADFSQPKPDDSFNNSRARSFSNVGRKPFRVWKVRDKSVSYKDVLLNREEKKHEPSLNPMNQPVSKKNTEQI
ncbi:hypothetical protein HRI_004447700 [Hibiscus trionum]|uniref:RRM domain-containing protein n=1 Tax=Hibiscus trionum TaxID=183268 RepID=A0A9W7J5J5_HIBTR|nr:hypothetical protein HRI_004447700 [Hibiscus trionum]